MTSRTKDVADDYKNGDVTFAPESSTYAMSASTLFNRRKYGAMIQEHTSQHSTDNRSSYNYRA